MSRTSRTLEIGTVVGLVLGCLSIFGSFMLAGGTMDKLILIPAMLIVFGGTFATSMIGVSLRQFLAIPRFTMVAFFAPRQDVPALIDEIGEIARQVRRQSLLAMEKELPGIRDPFLRRLLGLAIDGLDPTSLRAVAESEIACVAERHHANAGVFAKMGGYAPTMGIIGTVMGLIATLSHAGSDPNQLIHGIATAFIATLWGVFSANIIFLPLADKLKSIHAEESMAMEVVLEGVLSIQGGESPAVTRAKLQSMLPAGQQESR